MGISFRHKGDLKKTEKFLRVNADGKPWKSDLSKYGKMGVQALVTATPKDSGLTADSWGYEIFKENGRITLRWTNSNVNNGVNIAVILQYGHGTRNGGYVAGRDYLNPAMRPVFDKIAEEAWSEVTKH